MDSGDIRSISKDRSNDPGEVTVGVVITVPVHYGASSLCSSCLHVITEAEFGITRILLDYLSRSFVTYNMKATFKAFWLFLLVEITSSLNGGELAFSFSLTMGWIRIPEVKWKEAEIVYVWLFYFYRTFIFYVLHCSWHAKPFLQFFDSDLQNVDLTSPLCIYCISVYCIS